MFNFLSPKYFLWIIFLLFLGCSGTQSTTYLILGSSNINNVLPSALDLVSGTVTAQTPNSIINYTLDLNTTSPANYTNTAGRVSPWFNSVLSQNFSQATSNIQPELVTNGGFNLLNFKPNYILTANGVNPTQITTKFSMVTVLDNNANGFYFRFGTSDSTDAMIVDYNAGVLKLQHVNDSNAGNSAYRTYTITGTASAVITAVFGLTYKDMELYINGFRKVPDGNSTTVLGTPGDFNSLPRSFKIANSLSVGTNNFSTPQMIGYLDKLSPQKIYALSKYLGLVWGISISETINYEILKDTVPPIEPSVINFSYVEGVVLTNKCYTCHRPSSGIPNGGLIFNDYTSVTTGTYGGSQLVVAGNSSASLLYHSVEPSTSDPLVSDRMPKGGPYLTASEIKVIQDWIDGGAVQ